MNCPRCKVEMQGTCGYEDTEWCPSCGSLGDGFENHPLEEPKSLEVVRSLLRHVRRCMCLKPATYARALTEICDTCASNPTLEWLGDKEACKLPQADTVRVAMKILGMS